MGGSVKELYERGVKESFTQWGASGVDAYLQRRKERLLTTRMLSVATVRDMPAVSTITPKWDDDATADVKLERLIHPEVAGSLPQRAGSLERNPSYGLP